MAMSWFLAARKRARGLRLAFRRAAPRCEALEQRQLLASSIVFNPTGTPASATLAIGGIDEAPGSALARGSLPLTVGKTFQLDYEAVLGGVIDPNGLTVAPPGLNTNFQLTAVASFTEVVTSADPAVGSASFALAPVQAPNSFFELYYNPAVVANNLTGTGFNVGTRILSGTPSLSQSSSGNFVIAKGPTGVPIIRPFDQFNVVNYPGVLSVTGVGSSLIQVDVKSLDPAFFVSPVASLSFNTSTTAPFQETDPAARFVGSPGGAPPTVVANVGAVNGLSGPDFQFQADAATSFSAPTPSIAIVKATDGQVALTGPGPIIPVGSAVTWTYDVTNPGNEALKNLTVVDNAGTPGTTADDFAPTPVLAAGGFNVGDANRNGLLDPGEDFKFTATGVARAGQYTNQVVTAAAGNLSNAAVTAASTSNYFATAPSIAIVKATDGQVALTGPGPIIPVGSAVTWTYDVTNPGNEALKNLTLLDDGGTPGNPATAFAPTPVLAAGGFNVGDVNRNGLLDPGEDFRFTGSGVARAGQYQNFVTTTAAGSLTNAPVTAGSVGHYFAAAPPTAPAIAIVKATDGQVALTGPGPIIPVGSVVTFTYDVTNPGNEPLTNLTLLDDGGTPGNPATAFAPTPVLAAGGFNVGDVNRNGLLDPGEDFRFTGSGVARAGQYQNFVTTTAAGNLSTTPVTAGSVGHYFAAAPPTAPAIAIVKATDGQVALTGPGPIIPVGSAVTFTYDVTNPGNEPLTNLTLLDDGGTPGNPATAFAPTPVLAAGGFNVGDVNRNGLLDPGEDFRFTGSGVARAGQYQNFVTTTAAGNLSTTPVTAGSVGHYFAEAPAISVVKETNGQIAPTGPGPVATVGTPVTFTYLVTNPGRFPLSNVILSDDGGTPNNLANSFRPTFVGGDTNGNGLLDPGETFIYTATQQLASSGQYTNLATVVGLNPSGVPIAAQTLGNAFGVCPMVVAVQRKGVHLQPTQVVVTFNGPLNPTEAANPANFRLFAIGKSGRFDVQDRVVSAVYDPATSSVTLTAAHRLNVHHLSKIEVNSLCPGGPTFNGVLNRKFSLGAVTIVGKRGHHFVFPATTVPAVLNPSILPARLTPSNRAAVNRLSTRPESGAFSPENPAMVIGSQTKASNVQITAKTPRPLARHA